MDQLNTSPSEDKVQITTKIKSLLVEKQRHENEAKKTISNKSLMLADKMALMKSARSLSSTINGLLDTETDKLNQINIS